VRLGETGAAEREEVEAVPEEAPDGGFGATPGGKSYGLPSASKAVNERTEAEVTPLLPLRLRPRTRVLDVERLRAF
jgi:hypothetical protein